MIWLSTGNEGWYKMQPVSVTGIEITYISGALQRDIDFRSCKTFISIDGVVRTTFKRGIKESRADEDGNYLVPVSETYEYKFDYKEVERIFDRFDLFDLHPVKMIFRLMMAAVGK